MSTSTATPLCEEAICRCAEPFPERLSFAFQPIIDFKSRTIFAQEALVRGPEGESAGSVLSKVTTENMHAFDRHCRIQALKSASRTLARRGELLSLNTMPNAVYDPATCLRTTLAAATANGFPIDQIMFEMTEHEAVTDPDHFAMIVRSYKDMGFTTVLVHSEKDWSHEPVEARPATLEDILKDDGPDHIDYVTGDLAAFLEAARDTLK